MYFRTDHEFIKYLCENILVTEMNDFENVVVP